MGRAARAITQVPEFALPGDQAVETTIAAPVIKAAAEDVGSRRSPWRAHWLAWVIAASIALAVAGPALWYRDTVSGYQHELAAARADVNAIERDLASLPAKYEPMHAKAIADARAAANPYLHVVGPKSLPPNAQGHLHITTRHPEGELAACDLASSSWKPRRARSSRSNGKKAWDTRMLTSIRPA